METDGIAKKEGEGLNTEWGQAKSWGTSASESQRGPRTGSC